jgi:hypothetical protein
MKIVLFLIMAGINFYIADRKGFNPWAWILAAGFLGLLVIALLPSANDPDLDIEIMEKRRRTGTNTGIGISIAGILISLILILVISTL